jgi:hypothetical protein
MSAITPAVASATAAPRQALTGDGLGMDAAALARSILSHLEYTLAELPRTSISCGRASSATRPTASPSAGGS